MLEGSIRSGEPDIRERIACDHKSGEVARLVIGLLATDTAIRWTPGSTTLVNGMKRVCAMKEQGVPETVARVT